MRIHPIKAARALGALLDDPDDTAHFFTFVESLEGLAPERTLERLRLSRGGAALLAARPRLVDRLSDRASLRAMPEGSLGRAYLAFMERAGIDAAGLVEASARGRLAAETEDDMTFLRQRLRDSHDLWHVVTGYDPDLVGEAGVLAFTCAQTRSPGLAAFLLVVWARGLPGAGKVMRDALARGRRAARFVEVAWEGMLARPLDEVRRELGVGAPPEYVRVTTDDLRREGILPPRAAA